MKNPCGKCHEECVAGNAVVCGFCEFWFHTECVEGMSAEFIRCCDAINKFYGGSSFLCGICRKIVGKMNHNMKEMEERMNGLGSPAEMASKPEEVQVGVLWHCKSHPKHPS